MLSALFTSVADALISYAIDKLDPAERIKSWLRLDPARLAFKKALARAYSAFARQYPEYTSSLFDQSFLSTDALPELSKLLARNQHPDPALLAQAWGRSLGASEDFTQAATKPAAYFLERFEAELKAEPALQSIFDSRAVESLPKLEAEIQKLSADLQRGLDEALKAATDYQKVTLHIGGDIKDSNIIIGDNNQLTINKYYYSGDFIALNEYYIPPDGVFQRVRVDEFIGRDWLTAKVDAFLNDPNRKSGAFLLIGDAGVGKTSFMAHLVKERRYLHLFAEQAPGQAILQRAMQSLGSQLVTRYQIDPYKDRDTLNALSVFPDFLERILRLAASTLTEGEKIVIVCDALDEAGTFPDHFVFGLPKELPDGVYFILSQRPVNVKLPNFEPVIENLEAQGEGNLQDIEAYLSAVAKRPEVAGQIRSKEYSEDFFIQTLKEKSQGVWMYLHYIIKEIESGARAPLDLANLPAGLVGYYAEYWGAWRTGNRGKGEEAWDELYAPLLTTLAAAQEAIPVEWLIQWADVTAKPREVTRLLTEHWRAFITEKEVNGQKAYTPYHLSFKDFITGKVDTSKLQPTQANLVKDLAAQTVDAHKRIVGAFEKECNGQWEKLVEQDYPRLHLSTHLNGAGEYEKLRMLLTEGDEKIKWAVAREIKEETYAGYLNDLIHVWDYAEHTSNLALAIRCMLIENSINSQIENISPELITALAISGLWSYPKCISIIRKKLNYAEKASSLMLISTELPSTLFQEAITVANEINDDYYRSIVFSKLASCFTEERKTQAIQEALSASCRNKFRDYDKILEAHSSFLNKEQKAYALAIANDTKDEYLSTRIITVLFPYLSFEQQAQALAAAIEIDSELYRAIALSAIIPSLNEKQKSQALSAANKIRNKSASAIALAPLAAHLNENQKTQVLKNVFEIRDIRQCIITLNILVRHLNKEQKSQALLLFDYKKNEAAQVISTFISYLNTEQKLKALSSAREINSVTTRISVLSGIVLHLDDELKEKVLQEILYLSRKIGNYDFRIKTIVDLVPHLNIDLQAHALKEALYASSKIKNEASRVTATSAFVQYFNEDLKAQILRDLLFLTSKIKDASVRASALINLASNFNASVQKQILDEGLLAIHNIENPSTRSDLLIKIASYLSGEARIKVLQESLSISQKVNTEFALALPALTPYLSEKPRSQILKDAFWLAQKSKDKLIPIRTLTALIPCFSEEIKAQFIQKIYLLANSIEKEVNRVSALIELVPHLNQNLISNTFAVAQKLENTRNRARLISSLIPLMSEKQLMLVFSDACKTGNDQFRTPVLEALASKINEEQKIQAISTARKIKKQSHRARVLTALFPYLNKELKTQVLQEALNTANEIKDEFARARALIHLFPLLNKDIKEDILQDALTSVRKIQVDSNRINAFSFLIPHLRSDQKEEAVKDVLSIINKIQDQSARAAALSAIIHHLDLETKNRVLQDFLNTALKVKGEKVFTNVLLILLPHFDKEKQIVYLHNLLYKPIFNRSLHNVLIKWKAIEFYGLEERLIPFIKSISSMNRDDGVEVIDALTPALIHFSGLIIADELYRTITDVTRWWQ